MNLPQDTHNVGGTIEDIVGRLGGVRELLLMENKGLLRLRRVVATEKAVALSGGLVGKNPEARKVEQEGLLSESADYQVALADYELCEARIADLRNGEDTVKTEASLLKAYLWSLSRGEA